MEIFKIQCKKNGYALTEESESAAKTLFDELYAERDENFGNGRDVRNCFEDMIVNQADRISTMASPTKEDLMSVTIADLGVNNGKTEEN